MRQLKKNIVLEVKRKTHVSLKFLPVFISCYTSLHLSVKWTVIVPTL